MGAPFSKYIYWEYFQRTINDRKGFTLVELVVVIDILGILAAIAVPRLLGFQERTREQTDKQTAVQVRNAVALLYENGELDPDKGTAATDGTTFTVSSTGVFAYRTNTFYTTGVATEQEADTAIAATGTGSLQALVEELTDPITLESAGKSIQIQVMRDGQVIQELIP